MKRTLTIVAVVVAATLTVRAFYGRDAEGAPSITSEAISRGSIVSIVSATGTLEAVTTVQVGSQVSGSIDALYADFNSIVKKGQLLARLEQSLFRSAVEQAQANLVRAQADQDRAQVMLVDAESKLTRTRELAARQLIAANELDTAEVNRATAAAQVKSAAAAVTQARASVQQAQVNLSKTVIASPIDGIVISRNVDVGQTVAASMSAPTLFVIAADLTRMKLNASIDESDLGAIATGQPVRFTVDAYPNSTFTGTVEQVRLSPVVVSNVVTYAAIVSAPNPELRLMPGMTASLTVEVARRDDVLRAPAAATRFRPTAELLEALGAAPAKGSVLWQVTGESITAVPVKTGVSDGTWTELIDAPLEVGTQVVTRASIGAAQATTPARTNNPLMGTQPGRR